MKIRALTPTAFGKFQTSRPIELSDGLNIIRGDNEAGKSTLGAFILGMFYGFRRKAGLGSSETTSTSVTARGRATTTEARLSTRGRLHVQDRAFLRPRFGPRLR